MDERWRWRSWAAGMAVVLVCLVGCAHEQGLLPAPEAKVAPGTPKVAYDQSSGVEVLVEGDAWHGNPRDLDKVMTPIRVTVRNRSAEPVRITFKDFALETPSANRVNPLPPFSMHTLGPKRTSVVTTPDFDYDGFWVAPFYGPYYPTLTPWWRPWAYEPGFYDEHFVEWRVQLPTEEMLRAALPEGVVQPGGHVSGFLYFPGALPKNTGHVFTLRASFAKEEGTQSLAKVEIPLVTK
jgi:hypothetical protein